MLASGHAYRFSGWTKGTGWLCFGLTVHNVGEASPVGCAMATNTWQRFSLYVTMPTYGTGDDATTYLSYRTSAGADILLDEITWAKVADKPIKVETWQREQHGCAACAPYSLAFYDALGQVIQTRAESGPHPGPLPPAGAPAGEGVQVVVNTAYDALGRVIRSDAPVFEANATSFVPPVSGRPSATTMYDALGRVVQTVGPDGATVSSAYLGATTVVTDANGHRRESVSDGLGRLTAVVEISGAARYTTSYSYDGASNLTRVKDALGNTTVITYNALGRKTAMKDPDMGVWSYGYDAAGNLITQTDAKGQRLWFRYDALSRLLEKRLNNSAGELLGWYGYDKVGVNGIGRRTQMTNTVARASWVYDARGRVVDDYRTVVGVITGTRTSYAYDALDRVTQMVYPTGEVVTTTYDVGGQPYSLQGWNTYVVSATYTALGQPYRTRWGNGLETRYTYFGLDLQVSGAPNQFFGRLRQVCVTTPVNGNCALGWYTNTLLNLAYWYDAGGNVTTVRDDTNRQRQNYGYDALDRLVSAMPSRLPGVTSTIGEYTETYSYNAVGNFVSKGGVTQGYADPAHVHAVTHVVGDRRAWYDANGNMTRRVEIDPAPNPWPVTWPATQRITYTQEWTPDNLLRVVTRTAMVTMCLANDVCRPPVKQERQTRYAYDADGVRVSRTDMSGTVVYVGGMYEKWRLGDESRETVHYAWNGRPVAVRVRARWFGSPDVKDSVSYLHADHLGSTALVTGQKGARQAEARYKPFGEVRWQSEGLPTDRMYTSQRAETGLGSLMDYGARFYSPVLGRFLSTDGIVPDPLNPQALNRYSYVYNRPLNLTDPSGRDPLDAAWEAEFRENNGRDPTDVDRNDRLFSLLFCGHGSHCAWTDADWSEYHQHRSALWSADHKWWGGDPRLGIDAFAQHVSTLASYYKPNERQQFVVAVGAIWAGVPFGWCISCNAYQMHTNLQGVWAERPPLTEGDLNWDASMIEHFPDKPDNPAHHYAMYFYMAFFGESTARAVLWWADGGGRNAYNPPDVRLGQVAIRHGSNLADRVISISEVADAILYALDARGGIWANNTPGSR